MKRPLGPDGQPVRSHRRYDLSTRQRVVAGALIVATLTIGGVISDHQPSIDEQQRPFIRTGSVGRLIDVRSFDATVLGVRGGAVIHQKGLDHTTSGVWVLVKVRLEAHTEPMNVGYTVLTDTRGHIYRATARFGQPLVDGTRLLQPGIPLSGEIAFEVPVTVTGLTVQLARSELDQRMDVMAEVKLPIGDGALRQWQAQKDPMTIDAPVVAG